MFVWSWVVAAYIVTAVFNRRAIPFAVIYGLFHIFFDLLWYSPGYVYYPSCVIADVLILIIIRNFSYISSQINSLLSLSALLNFAGFGLYVAELPNLLYDLSVVLCHACILFLLQKDQHYGWRDY